MHAMSEPTRGPLTLLIGTRKGGFLLKGDAERREWAISPPKLLGNIVLHMVSDPRAPERVLMAARAGHLGPTVFTSSDGGASFKEASKPPAFPKVEAGASGRSVEDVFWLTPGHPSTPGRWYAGVNPAGLFVSDDHGDTWEPVGGFNDHPELPAWTANGGSPAGLLLHSILVDPRDPDHLYLGISVGGTFESTDGGATWRPLNKGVETDFIPGPPPEYGQDPHCMAIHPAMPDRLYQQNHCGIYRIDRPSDTWVRIGRNMPAEVGDIGFPVVVHPRDPDTAWVFPMDGTSVWPRTSPGGRPAAYVTHDAGASWQRQDRGLPPGDAWFTVYRQAMAGDSHDPVGLYFGTTTGEVWASRDGGESWACIARHLPHVLSVEVMVGV